MLFRSNDTATTEIYTLSLHDALPISVVLADDYFDDQLAAFNQARLTARQDWLLRQQLASLLTRRRILSAEVRARRCTGGRGEPQGILEMVAL